jgi:UPF0716 protein FxsA
MAAGRVVVMTLLVLLIGLPILEIVVAAWVASVIGFWWMVLALVGLSALGLFLLPKVGLSSIRRVQVALRNGERPAPPLVNGGLMMVAALMLLLPGFVTGVCGLLLLIPPIRHGVARYWMRRFGIRYTVIHSTPGGGLTAEDVIDADSSESQPPPRPELGGS